MRNIIIAVIAILVIIVGYFLFKGDFNNKIVPIETDTEVIDGSATSTEPVVEEPETETVIGKSVAGRDITAYHFGTGAKEILFVGGTHGGYSWNTALVAYEMMAYLAENLSVIPSNLKVTVIPVLNPDGLNKVVSQAGPFTKSDVSGTQEIRISGRFNENEVDLNRNFDCDWQATGKWQSTSVSGGEQAFSEPETLAFKNYIESRKPNAVVVWYSSAGGVFASNCHGGVLPETTKILDVYSKASGYKAYQSFDFYTITGDMVNWLAKKNIPAISVLLTTHEDTEWSKNQKGLEALLKYYAE